MKELNFIAARVDIQPGDRKDEIEVNAAIDKSEIKPILEQFGYDVIAKNVELSEFLDSFDISEILTYVRDYGYTVTGDDIEY